MEAGFEGDEGALAEEEAALVDGVIVDDDFFGVVECEKTPASSKR